MGEKKLHIGLMKCGSTSIQSILNELSETGCIDYVGFRPGPIDEWYSSQLISDLFNKYLISAHEKYFYAWLAEKRNDLDKLVYSNGDDFWVSFENLSGINFGYDISVGDKLIRLKAIFGNFQEINIVIRPLDKIIISWFWEVNKRGYIASVADFVEYLNLCKSDGFIYNCLPSFLLQKVQSIFPNSTLSIHLGVNSALSKLSKIYDGRIKQIDQVQNASSQNLCVKSEVNDLWSQKEKHRYLWSEKDKLDEDFYFSQLRAAQFIEYDLDIDKFTSQIRPIFAEEIREEIKLLDEMGLRHVADYSLGEHVG